MTAVAQLINTTKLLSYAQDAQPSAATKSQLALRPKIPEDSRMLLPILAGIVVVALVVVAVARGRRRQQRPGDLGSISEAWIAQHRASWYDVDR